MEARNLAPVAAAASEPIPIRRRSPLSAVTAVQALCNRMKNKLVKPMTQERLLRATCGFTSTDDFCLSTLVLMTKQLQRLPPSYISNVFLFVTFSRIANL